MKYKLRNIIMFLSAFVMVFTVVVLCDPVWASALEPPSDSVVLRGATYDSSNDFCNTLDSVGGSVPSGYNLVAVLIQPGAFTSNQTGVKYYYAPSSFEYLTAYVDNDGYFHLSNSPNSDRFYYVHNRFSTSGNQNTLTNGYGYSSGTSSSGTDWLFFSFINVLDKNGDPIYAPSRIPFNLNVLSVSHHLYWNTTLDESGASLFTSKFYIFPSSFPLTSTPTTIISNKSFTDLSDSEKQSFIDRFFNWYLNKITLGIYDNKTSIPIINNFTSVLASPLSSFNPDLYNLDYSYLGQMPVYRFGSDSSSDVNNCAYIDLKQVSRTGVWANSDLCLVSVCEHDNVFSIARYDFNIDDILSGSVVPPTGLTHFDTYNSAVVTDLQELANFIALCFETSDSNVNISIRNMTAYLQSIPWKQYVSGGVYDGLSDFLPALSNLVSSNQLSLPDLTTGLAPFFNSLDITPTGNFANFLGGINTNLNTHLDSLFGDLSTDLSTLKTGLDTSITDLSTEINANTTRIFVPDLVDMSDRLDVSADLLSDKFEFADDIKDNLEDIRDTIEDSSEQPPDWSFTVYNVQLFLVDWSVYQPYRAYVQNILIAIAYILLFKHIYKTIPLNGGDE